MERGKPAPALADRVIVAVDATPRRLPSVTRTGIQSVPDESVASELPLDPAGRDGAATTMLRGLGRRHERRIPMDIQDRRDIILALYQEGREFPGFMRRFAVLMVISVLIAVFGLVADSTAVVIGAMLVAPLLTPVLGLSAAVVMGWPIRVARHSGLIALASAGAVAMAALMAFALPLDLDPIPSELLARTNPNLLDLGVAVGAGSAGAFAIVRRRAADAMSGAAVAVALVPPLGAVGVLLRTGEVELATGAALLFITNVVGVVAAGAVVFVATGFVPGVQLVFGARRTVGRLRWIALVTVALVFLLQSGNHGLIPTAPALADVEQVVDEWSSQASPAMEVVDLAMDIDDGAAIITAVVAASGEPPPVDSLATALAETLDRPVDVELQVVVARSARASVEEAGG